MFTEVYLKTTDPNLHFTDVISRGMIFSVIFHTVMYTVFVNVVSYIFLGKILSNVVNMRLVATLVFIMFFGFFARFLHVKEIYKSYGYNLEKTRNHTDKLYIGWIFIS